MAGIEDWASEAARRIKEEPRNASEARIAAIIATFAAPLVKLVEESRREHRHVSLDTSELKRTRSNKTLFCCPQCCCESWPDDPEMDFEPTPNEDLDCDCGADAWNARVDAVLLGIPAKPPRPARARRTEPG